MSNQHPTDALALQKDPDDWKTGDEPMTAAQRSYLETLARDSGETVDASLARTRSGAESSEPSLDAALTDRLAAVDAASSTSLASSESAEPQPAKPKRRSRRAVRPPSS